MNSLIERLGDDGLQRIIDEAYHRVFQDDMLRPFFENTDMDRLRHMQRAFLEAALTDDTAAQAEGPTIRQAHHGRGITREHFTRFVECFLKSMEAAGDVSQSDIDQVIGRLNTYADSVIGSSNVDG